MNKLSIWAVACVGALLIGGFATVAMANGGRIAIPDVVEGNDSADVEGNDSAYAGDATITSDDAKSIAEDYTSGTANSIELENEDGFLVYGVSITSDAGQFDVKIDAGNGQVLKLDNDDGNE